MRAVTATKMHTFPYQYGLNLKSLCQSKRSIDTILHVTYTESILM